MIPDLLNYKVSILNPLLKLILPFLFLWGTYYLYRARSMYQGELGKVVQHLFIAGIVGCLVTFFRYGADIWFSSLKWGESLFNLVFAIVNVYAAWPLLTFMLRMSPKSKYTQPEAIASASSAKVKS